MDYIKNRKEKWNIFVMKHIAIYLLLTTFLSGQTAFDYPPLNYASTEMNNDAETLLKKINNGETKLKKDDKYGYLPALLKALDIPASSQVLVFSQTSFQKENIDIKNPRALYFNERNYVGKVQNSEVLEIASYDANNGAVFYTLEESKEKKLRLLRNDEDCLNCHSSFRTQSVPGIMLRSIFLNKEDSLKSRTVTHRTPLNERWGSWYVTGDLNKNEHLGNIINSKGQEQEHKNIDSLKEFFDTDKYLLDQSDVIALMILEHQAHMTNLITRANFRTRVTLHRQKELNKDMQKSADHISEYAMRDIARNGDSLVRYLLFSEEAKLNSPITGSEKYVSNFQKNAVKDSKGRSLKDLNLKSRLLEYPCSYMIYSQNFEALPKVMKDYIYKKLYGVLTGKDKSEEFQHLNAEMRQAILEILLDTKKDLPDYWKE